ncbi:MAG: ATP-binding protein, partial [Thioalkalivibrio sp.]|nr:ATP-binding protein [Thioalkalivibrio sp.]
MTDHSGTFLGAAAASTVPPTRVLQRDPLPASTGLSEKAQVIAAAAHALYWHGELPSIEPDTPALARVAVEQLAADFKDSPQAFVEALEGARAGAEVLSTDRLQGLSEIVQNADDAGASRVEFNFLPEELIVTHDGRPVNLRDVLALATPWLTTKRNEATAIGRFGIGLMTLQALSPALEVYSGPYSVRLESPSLAWIDPPAAAAATRAPNITIFRVPLSPGTLEREEIARWIERWDDAALLFCASVEEVTLRVGGEPFGTLRLHWTAQDNSEEVRIGAASCAVHRRRAAAGDGRCWAVHTADAPVPDGLSRSHKAHGQTTPLGVALPLTHADEGTVYAGLPLAEIGVPARVHGQFDPTSSRQGLAETSWNDALYTLVADLWTAAAARLFLEQPAAAWSAVPLPEEDTGGGGTGVLRDEILDRARTELPRRVVIDTGGSERHLTELAVEVPALAGVITPGEVARLAGLPQALPASARDAAERWREVLEDWRQADAPIPPEVDVEQALELLNEPGRGPDAVIALVAAAVEEDLDFALEELPTVVLADGSQVPPPAASDPWMLVTGEGGVGATLGITRALHPAYMTRSAPADVVLEWLRRIGASVDAHDVAAVLARLARTGAAGGALQEALLDVQVVALRDALDQLSPEGRAKVGPGIGKAVLLQGFRFARGGTREEVTIAPALAYLPTAIERAREPGFAEAATETPGLYWVHGRYAKVLRSTGRASLGPLRFLQLLGAETVPRLRLHPKLAHRYVGAKRGLPDYTEGGPTLRSRALGQLRASYTLEDMDSPDLTAVLRSIAAERKPVQRRERAAAMLATLGRAWERLSGRAFVQAASDYYSWQSRGRTRAFWLWQAAEIPWLDDAKGTATAPHALQRRTPATVAVRGPAPTGYLHRDLTQHLKVLEALGVAGDPDTGTLVRALRDLRSAGTDDLDLPARTALIYRTLAERLGDDSRMPGDLPQAQIVAAFHEPPGLLFTNLGWSQPGGVLTGTPIFGRWRAFTPSIQGADRLWATLKLKEPSAADSIDVLLRMGTAGAAPDTNDEIVMLESLRLLVRNTAEVQSSQELPRTLAKLPLWTSDGWKQRRPVYAATDLPLADGLANELPIWRPGGDVSQFTPLFDALRL